ncbi:histidine kinase, partial [Methylobacterium frigidaeris]
MPHSRQPLQSSPEASEPLQTLRRGGQLFETERRLNAVLNNASVAIFLMDDRQHCIYMNRAAELLTGYTLDEVLARDCPLHDIVHHT